MPMKRDKDLFKLAAQRVANKSFKKRIWHSGSFHSFRSAWSSSGSRWSKGAGVASSLASAALSTLPIPAAISGAIDNAKNALVAARRKKLHEAASEAAHAAYKGSKDQCDPFADKAVEQIVKFDIKELDISNLDRYRWKVHNAMKEVVEVYKGFGKSYAAAESHGKTCDALLEMAEAVMQARRRIEILKGEMEKLAALSSFIESWLATSTATLNEYQRHAVEAIQKEYHPNNAKSSRHKHCGDYCWLGRASLGSGAEIRNSVVKAYNVANTLLPITSLVKIELDEGGGVKVKGGVDMTFDKDTKKGLLGVYNGGVKTDFKAVHRNPAE